MLLIYPTILEINFLFAKKNTTVQQRAGMINIINNTLEPVLYISNDYALTQQLERVPITTK